MSALGIGIGKGLESFGQMALSIFQTQEQQAIAQREKKLDRKHSSDMMIQNSKLAFENWESQKEYEAEQQSQKIEAGQRALGKVSPPTTALETVAKAGAQYDVLDKALSDVDKQILLPTSRDQEMRNANIGALEQYRDSFVSTELGVDTIDESKVFVEAAKTPGVDIQTASQIAKNISGPGQKKYLQKSKEVLAQKELYQKDNIHKEKIAHDVWKTNTNNQTKRDLARIMSGQRGSLQGFNALKNSLNKSLGDYIKTKDSYGVDPKGAFDGTGVIFKVANSPQFGEGFRQFLENDPSYSKYSSLLLPNEDIFGMDLAKAKETLAQRHPNERWNDITLKMGAAAESYLKQVMTDLPMDGSEINAGTTTSFPTFMINEMGAQDIPQNQDFTMPKTKAPSQNDRAGVDAVKAKSVLNSATVPELQALLKNPEYKSNHALINQILNQKVKALKNQ